MTDRLNTQEGRFAELRDLIQADAVDQAVSLFLNLHLGDQVEVFGFLEEEHRATLLHRMDVQDIARLFNTQDDDETLEAAEGLSTERLADVLDVMEPDEAADLLGDLHPEQAAQALQAMEESEDVLPLLHYPDETAGGRMTTDFVAIPQDQTSQEAIQALRDRSPEQEVRYYLFIVDEANRLVGVTGLRELVIALPGTTMSAIMNPEVLKVDAWMDQEEVARIMIQYDLSSLPVIDERGRLVGVITHDDVLDVLQEEATEDIYRLANVTDAELEPDSPVGEQLRGRLPWLFLNTLTALFAAWVISHFEDLIAQIAALAVFQTVVAGLGGNAASQSVAMFVRALAIGEIPSHQRFNVLMRQMWVGLLQGLAIGITVGLGVYLWRGNLVLGIVLGLALVGNLLLAGVVGTLIPVGLKAFGLDPAMAGTVLVTAITDSLGFLIFLSLASLFVNLL
jgi:magnesium transporter